MPSVSVVLLVLPCSCLLAGAYGHIEFMALLCFALANHEIASELF